MKGLTKGCDETEGCEETEDCKERHKKRKVEGSVIPNPEKKNTDCVFFKGAEKFYF